MPQKFLQYPIIQDANGIPNWEEEHDCAAATFIIDCTTSTNNQSGGSQAYMTSVKINQLPCLVA